MSRAQLYDTIGATYTVTRRTEPRIAATIWASSAMRGPYWMSGLAPAPTSRPTVT